MSLSLAAAAAAVFRLTPCLVSALLCQGVQPHKEHHRGHHSHRHGGFEGEFHAGNPMSNLRMSTLLAQLGQPAARGTQGYGFT